jgi:TetR/AcrR family transcriptional regulator, cholesterol catabolism regulator
MRAAKAPVRTPVRTPIRAPIKVPVEEHTRGRILAIAAQRFARDGYAATSVRDIARSAGVTVGAIYVHFPSKGRLLVAVYQEGARRIGRAVDAAAAGAAGPWERLGAAAAAHLETLLADGGSVRGIVRVLPEDVPEVARDLRRLREAYEMRFRRLIEALDLAPGVDRTLLRLMLLGALNATQVWFQPAGRADAAAIARQFVATLETGARTPGKGHGLG